MASLNIDLTNVEADAGGNREPIPAGRYVLQVVESDVAATSSGTGLILKTIMEVFDGEFKGRRVFENFNIQNQNAQAQEIAQRQLKALAVAAGINPDIRDSSELHYQPFEADVKIDPGRTANGKTYGPRNAIAKYHFEGQRPAPRSVPQARPAAAAAAPKQSRPWDRQQGGDQIPF